MTKVNYELLGKLFNKRIKVNHVSAFASLMKASVIHHINVHTIKSTDSFDMILDSEDFDIIVKGKIYFNRKLTKEEMKEFL